MIGSDVNNHIFKLNKLQNVIFLNNRFLWAIKIRIIRPASSLDKYPDYSSGVRLSV